MTKKFAGLFGSSQWLMERSAQQGLVHKLEQLTPEALQAAEAAAVTYARSSDPAMVGDVAVIPICGPIFYKPSWYAMYFGGAILSTIRAQFRTAVNDPNVTAIVFPFDSPGGIVDMVPEFAKEIFAARGKKPIIAVADTMIASCAYWLASQADQIYVTESSRLGAIGVYVEHEDVSAMLEKVGVKVTLIAYGEHKVDGNPYEPLSDAARAKIQEDVNRAGEKFTLAVARGRGVTKKVVLDTFGQGQCFDGETAVALGMADKVAAFDQVIAKATKGRGARAETFDMDLAKLVTQPSVGAETVTGSESVAYAVTVVGAKADAADGDGVEPDEAGMCADGYSKGDDGLCYVTDPEVEGAAARQARADVDLTATALALTDLP